MYSYRRLGPTRQTSSPQAPPPPLRTSNSNLSTDAYGEDEALGDSRSPRGFGFPATAPCRSRITLPTNESWTYEETTHTSSSEVAVTEQMLSELTKHVEETEVGGDNVSDI